MLGRLPDWLGIGCVKCGTSWVWRELAKHPQIYSPTKELNYFNYKFPINWYTCFFDGIEEGQLAGEWTPDYFHHYEAMHNIKEVCPWVKMLTIFRHPVERAFSNYKHALYDRRFTGTFSDAFNEWKIRDRSIYSKYLKKWYQLFPKRQIKILWHDDIHNPEFFKQICRFLEIDDFMPQDMSRFEFEYHKHTDDLQIDDRDKWLKFYLPYTEELERMTGRDLSNWKR